MIISLLIGLAVATAAPKGDPCNGSTTPEMNACGGLKLEASTARLHKYLRAALHRYADKEKAAVRRGILASQNAFEVYRATECATVYEDWKEGTIRGAMEVGCEIDLTDERAHDIWQHWLHYMDSAPPVLPEPKPTK